MYYKLNLFMYSLYSYDLTLSAILQAKNIYLNVVSLGRYGMPLAFISRIKFGGNRPATDMA